MECVEFGMLNFLRSNLYRCNQEVRSMAYTHLVRPTLEYASCVWDPYFDKDINALKNGARKSSVMGHIQL